MSAAGLRSRAALAAAIAVVVALLAPLGQPPARADWGAVTAAQADDQRRITLGAQHTCAVLDDGQVQCWGSNEDGQLGTGTTKTSTRPRTVLGVSTAVAVAAGQRHTCALLHGGRVRCWGLDGSGQVGDGQASIPPVTTPATVQNLTDATAIGAGAASSCALRATGQVVCWGHDGSGQLGNGTPVGETGTSAVPVTVSGLTDATAIAVGDYHACARKADDTVACWGSSAQGRLGNGMNNADSPVPVPVTGLPAGTKLVALAAGGQHTCAIDDDGAVWCWGDDTEGQLGDGRSRKTETPPPHAVNPVKVQKIGTDDPKAVVVTAGGLHTCALLTDQTARCWGSSSRKQLAVFPETADPVTEPKPVAAAPVANSKLGGIDALVVGGYHSCVLIEPNLSCWGFNFTGQLGLRQEQSKVPVQSTGVQGATAVTVGTRFACVRQIPPGGDTSPSGPRVPACWGDGLVGQLGSAVPDDRSDVPVVVPGLADVAQMDSGNGTTCALPADSSTPWCWGRGSDGALGDGTTADRAAPGPVSLAGATQVSVGGRSFSGERVTACAAASGMAKCWGYGAQGQLGDNDTQPRTTPVTVVRLDDSDPPVEVDLTGVSLVAAGGDHSCAVVGGKVWCWGAGGAGQLGNDDNESSPAAVEVATLTGVTQLVAGVSHTCALQSPKVWCWGFNSSGQLGDDSSTSRLKPVEAKLPNSAVAGNVPVEITAGDSHTCARLAGGDVWCWGANGSGQLGDNSTTNRDIPVRAVDSPDDGVLTAAIGAGRVNTCAAYVDLSVWCWGDNARDQMGDGMGNAHPWPTQLGSVTDTVGTNHLPDPVDDAETTDPATAVTIDVLANDSDPDPGDTITLTVVSDPSRGTAAIGSGDVTYTPDANACDAGPTDTFEYGITDDHGGTVLATVTITIACPNKLPTAVADTIAAVEDEPAALALLANDSDPDGHTLTVLSNTSPAHGSVTLAPAGTGTYDPAQDACGSDAFTYTIEDGHDGTAMAVVSITVACRQDAPVAGDDLATAPEDTPVTIDVLGNDGDVDIGDTLHVTQVTAPTHGQAVVTAGDEVVYTPAADYCGPDSFNYTVSDGGRTDTGQVSVTVSCDPDAPRAADDTATTDEDTAVVVDVLANDTDTDGDALTVTQVGGAAHGQAEIVAGGVKYTPDPNFCGADSFGYTIEDAGGHQATAVANGVAVRCVQDNPVPVDDALSTQEDTAATFGVLANDTDPDGDVLAIRDITQPLHGSASITAGGIAYHPAANYCGTDQLTYTVGDGHGGTATAILGVDVECVQDAPTLAAVPAQTIAWGDELQVVLTAGDVDGDALTFALVSPPAGATVSPLGIVQWQPTETQVGTPSLTVRVSDGVRTAQRTFAVEVTRRATAIAWTGATSGTWSDNATASALLTDAVTGAPVSGRAVSFKIGTSATVGATTGGAGTATAAVVLTGPSGPATGTASFAGDGAWTASQAATTFDIQRETATVRVTGTHLTLTSATSANLKLVATVTEDADGRLGGALSTTKVVFSTIPDGRTCTASVSTSAGGTGTATCTLASVPLGSRGVVAVLQAANYTAPVDVTAAAVAAPTSGSASGGGEVGAASDRPAFAFAVKPNRKAGPAGDAVQVWRATADLGSGSRPYAFVAHSVTPTSLATKCNAKTKTCTVTLAAGGASLTAVDLGTGTVMGLAGTVSITMWATDAGEPLAGSVPPDRYAVSVTGPWPFTLGTATNQQLLTAGNVRVPG